MKPFSIYLHIPYCQQKCPYCDFNTYAVNRIPEDQYTLALIAELDFYSTAENFVGRPVQTIFFGGGTPSLFSVSSIRKIIAKIKQRFPVHHAAEISIEANPGPLTADKIQGFAQAGINRLSLGSQSFTVETLKTLGRTHRPEDIEAAIGGAKSAGIENLSLDLIYGVPRQTLDQLKFDLEETTAMNPSHISAYGLTIEKGTPFYTAYKKGTLILPAEDLLIEMMDEISNYLPSSGYQRYEISNFAADKLYARHNLAYWDGDDYLGLGAGAHSYCRDNQQLGTRWANYASPEKYIDQAMDLGDSAAWREDLSLKEAIFEYFFLGLRKLEGVSLTEFEKRFGAKVSDFYGPMTSILVDQELIEIEDSF
ncbi:MAG: radical SAM family heme chaperone HemW [Bdellovibrionota bacterium]